MFWVIVDLFVFRIINIRLTRKFWIDFIIDTSSSPGNI